MSRISVYDRQASKVKGQLTERDLTILQCLQQYRYLQTKHIQRLCFPEVTTPQSPRRRLKFLFHHRYINRLPMPIVPGHGSSEVVYYLDRLGYEAIDPEELFPRQFKKNEQVKPHFLAHAVAVSEFRVGLEEALRKQSVIELHRFVPDHELKSNRKGLAGRHRYRLFDEVFDPVTKDKQVVYPDAEIVLRGVGALAEHQRLYFVEIDRGTEGLGVLQDKVAAYELFRQSKKFKKKGAFDDYVVLFQTNSEARLQNMIKRFSHLEGAESVWATCTQRIAGKDLLSSPVWEKVNGEKRSILNT